MSPLNIRQPQFTQERNDDAEIHLGQQNVTRHRAHFPIPLLIGRQVNLSDDN